MELKILRDAAASLWVVTGGGFVLECFDSQESAANYVMEYTGSPPRTVGECTRLAKKHGAAYRNGE